MTQNTDVLKKIPSDISDILEDWESNQNGMAYDEDDLIPVLNTETGLLVFVPENHIIVVMSKAISLDADIGRVLTISGENYQSISNNLSLPCPNTKDNEDFWIKHSNKPLSVDAGTNIISEAGRRIIYKTCDRMGVTLKDMLTVINIDGQQWHESTTEQILEGAGIDHKNMSFDTKQEAAIAVIDKSRVLEYEANHNLDGETLHLYFSRQP